MYIEVLLVLTLSIYKFVLVPLELEFMRTIVFILVIAAMVQILEMLLLIQSRKQAQV